MTRPEFRPKLASTNKPLNFLPSGATLSIFKNTFRFPTIILIGALIQIPFSATLPTRYAVLPALGLLLSSVITTITQVRNPLVSEYMRYVVPGRVTAQVPSASTASLGKFSSQPAEAPIVVFNIGSQFNHPLGLLAPGIKELGERFKALERDLIRRREELGMLGVSSWTGDERASNNTIMITCYFRDLESLHRFAHEPMHRDTTDWFHKMGYSHIGVFHETFCVPAKAYETIYLNCRPLLLGRAAVKISSAGEDSEWANCLVDADTPVLKTQYSRLSRDETGKPKETE
ncbi:hypothetical protein EDB81DRAFT_269004 [Dactylonectria macrodidyma]|uniref:Uncharacterized protein n=1 Tax=Dactylonectria macrodidyma TaxID=307937 RepID=A0A9P9FMN9_9HYPO|nr:hypothetical protein EDB81DRAFT_269004 [Dactylonectria macrodidyma]